MNSDEVKWDALDPELKHTLFDHLITGVSTPKSDEVLKEDSLIEKFPLSIQADRITIVPVDQMFAK